MSGKSEVVEGILSQAKEKGLGLLKEIGNPLSQLSNPGANALQRIAGGAAAGGLAGMGLNLSTGIAGSILSPITGGLFTQSGSGIVNGDSFSMGSVLGSGVRGAFLGGAIAGGGFKNVNGINQMRSGTKAFVDMVAGGAHRLGLSPSSNSALGKHALAGEMGDSMMDLVAGRMKFSGKGMKNLKGNRVEQVNSNVQVNRYINNRAEAFPKQKPSFQVKQKKGEYAKLSPEDQERALAYRKEGEIIGVLKANRPAMPSEMTPVKDPSLKDAAKGHFRQAKDNKMQTLGAASIAGGLGMSLYQTNALGISIPSNRGYR